jgi:hypothetical protein
VLLNPNPALVAELRRMSKDDLLPTSKDDNSHPDYWKIQAKGAASLAASVVLVRPLAPKVAEQLLDPWVNESPVRGLNRISKTRDNMRQIFIVSRLLILYATLDSDEAVKSRVHDIVAGLLVPVIGRYDTDVSEPVKWVLTPESLQGVLTLIGHNLSEGFLQAVLSMSQQDVANSLIPKAQLLKKFLDCARSPPVPVKEFGYNWREECWTLVPSGKGWQDWMAKWYQLPYNEWTSQAQELCGSHGAARDAYSLSLTWSELLGDEWRKQLAHEWEQLRSSHPANSSQAPVKNLAYYAVEHVCRFTAATEIDLSTVHNKVNAQALPQ